MNGWLYQHTYSDIENTDGYGKDPYCRWLDELPPTPGNERLLTTRGNIRFDWNGDGIVADGRTQCNMCLKLFGKKHIYGLDDTYSTYTSNFSKTANSRLSTAQDEIRRHSKENHDDSVIHHFMFSTEYPGSGQRWPWEMTIAAVAQEVLWEAFVEDSIPLSTCFGAWSAKNESLLKLQVIQIVSVARGRVRAQKEKVIRRMYCEGIIIPSDIGRYMRWWEGDWNEKQTSRKNKPRKRKPVKEWFEAKPFTDLNTMRRKQATDEFLLAVEAFLKEQGERWWGFLTCHSPMRSRALWSKKSAMHGTPYAASSVVV